MSQIVYSDIDELNASDLGNIGVIIGNFDGVHLGHQFLIQNFISNCSDKNITPVVLTFSPHPVIFLKKELGPFLINTPEENKLLLHNLGLNNIFELNFNNELQSLGPEEFFEKILFKIKNLKLINLGHDFSLGQGKVPAKEILKTALEEHQIELVESKPFLFEDEILSSTMIRKLIKEGDVSKASHLLGRTYSLTEHVVNGYGVGRKELVPTANMKIYPNQLHPKSGVYFTQTIYKNQVYVSITNIGFRPSLKDDSGLSIETNIFNFKAEIYDEVITVNFLKFHRDEIKFKNKEELLTQIQKDIKACEEYHA